jgi:hypothetical protein
MLCARACARASVRAWKVVVGVSSPHLRSFSHRLLLRAVEIHGDEWWKVATLVPGRTDVQCRERYINSLKSGAEWTSAEIDALKEARERFGARKWGSHASHLASMGFNRTSGQCKLKFAQLFPAEMPSAEEEMGQKQGPARKIPRRGSSSSQDPAAIAGAAQHLTSAHPSSATDGAILRSFLGVGPASGKGAMHAGDAMLPPRTAAMEALLHMLEDPSLSLPDNATALCGRAGAKAASAQASHPAYTLLVSQMRSVFSWPIKLSLLPPPAN